MSYQPRTNNLQNLYQLKNQPGQNPEDAYLAQLATQPGKVDEWPATTPNMNQPSEAGIGDLQGRFNKANDIGMNSPSGIGSLAGGIASLILAPRVAKANAQAEGNRIRAQNINLQSKELSNQEMMQKLAQTQKTIDYAKSLSNLGLVQSGTDQSPETVKSAGASFNPDGTIKNNAQVFDEWKAQGKIDMDPRELMYYAPGLIGEFQKVHSTLTEDQFQKSLDDAAKQRDNYNKSLLELKKAKINAGEDEGRKNFTAAGQVTEGLAKFMENLYLNKDFLNPEDVDKMLDDVVFPGIDMLDKFQKKKGLVDPGDKITKGEVYRAYDEARKTGTPQPLSNVMNKLEKSFQTYSTKAAQPPGTPDKEKTTKPPIVTGTSTSTTTAPKSNPEIPGVQ